MAVVEAACDVLQLIAESCTASQDAGEPAPVQLSSADWACVAAVTGARDASVAAALWPTLTQQRGVTPSALGTGLCALVTGSSKADALHAAVCYASLLGSPGCPAFSAFNAVAFEGSLKALRDAAAVVATAALAGKAAGRSSKAKKAAAAAKLAREQAEDVDIEDVDDAVMEDAFGDDEGRPAPAAVTPEAAAAGAATILGGLRAALDVLPLRDVPEAHKHAVEALTAVAGVPPSAGAGGLDAPLSTQALAVLRQLLRPEHGDVLPSAAAQMQRLSPVLLASSGRGSAGAAALEYVRLVATEVPQARQAASALVRHLCLRCGDKADVRARATEAAAVLLGALPRCETAAFITFLGRLSRSANASHRSFATDLAPVLLSRLPEPFATPEPWGTSEGGPTPCPASKTPGTAPKSMARTPGSTHGDVARMDDGTWSPALPAGATPGTPGAGPRQPWGVVCMQLLVQRASDRIPAVRARALSALADAAGRAPDAAEDTSALQRMLGSAVTTTADGNGKQQQQPLGACTPGSGLRAAVGSGLGAGITPGTVLFLRRCGRLNTPGGESDASAGGGSDGTGAPAAPSVAIPAVTAAAGTSGTLAELLCLRTRDEKGGVRRAALAAVEAVALATGTVSDADVAACCAACSDTLLSVRKTALAALCHLLAAHPDTTGLAAAWLTHALPLVNDPESAVSEAAIDAAEALLLGGVVAWGKRGAAASASAAVGDALLRALGGPGESASAYIAAAVDALARRSRVKPAALAALQARLGSTGAEGMEAPGAWLLLAELTEATPSGADAAVLLSSWDALRKSSNAASAAVVAPSLLRAVAAAASRFAPAHAGVLAQQLETAVTAHFNLAPAVAAAYLRACAALAKRADAAPANAWAGRVFSCASAVLEPLVVSATRTNGSGGGGGGPSPAAEQAACGALHAAGQTALLAGPGVVPGELVTLVQALVAVPHSSGSGAGGVAPHAWAALVKLCLADERLAKRCVTLFVRELGGAHSPAVRNNLLVGLADLCVHHTALVDPHALRLAACLGDPCELVRRQALLLLASLLQRDYLKWRGQLFVRFAAALADESPGVRALASRLLADPQLAPRVPLLAYNHFAEALFSLNGFDGGAAVAAAGRAAPEAFEKSTLGLGGSDASARAKRLEVLRSLLRAMTPEHRLATASKLVSEVLVPIAEGTMPLPACSEVLVDALNALAAKEMSFKAPTGKGAAAAAAGDDDDDDAGAGGEHGTQLAHAKARVVSSLAKRNVVEHFVPVLIELRTLLTQIKSPLVAHLMACARATLRDFKEELEDILVADRQLAAELAFDLKRGEEDSDAAEKQPVQQVATRAQPSRGARRQAASQWQTPGAGVGLARASPAVGRSLETPGGALPRTDAAAPVAPMSVPRIRATPRTSSKLAAVAAADVGRLELADIRRRQSFSQAATLFGDENAAAPAAAAPKVVHFLSPDREVPAAPKCLNMPLPTSISFDDEEDGGFMEPGVRGMKRMRA